MNVGANYMDLSVGRDDQTIIVTLGEGVALFLSDDGPATDIDDLAVVQRRVLIARLRAWADIIEQGLERTGASS